MNQPPSDEDVEAIVLLAYLTEMTIVDAAYAVIKDFDRTDFEQTAALTIRITECKKSLDNLFKDAHSQPTNKGE